MPIQAEHSIPERQALMCVVEQCHANILSARALKRAVDRAQMLTMKLESLKASLPPPEDEDVTQATTEGETSAEKQQAEEPKEVLEIKATIEDFTSRIEEERMELKAMRDGTKYTPEECLKRDRMSMSRGILLRRLFDANEVDIGVDTIASVVNETEEAEKKLGTSLNNFCRNFQTLLGHHREGLKGLYGKFIEILTADLGLEGRAVACSQEVDSVPRKDWKRTDIRESLLDVVEEYEDEVERLLEERQESAESAIEFVFGEQLPIEESLPSLVVKCIKAEGERVLAQSRQAHVYFAAIEKSVLALSEVDTNVVKSAISQLQETLEEERRNGGHSKAVLWSVYQACENAVLVGEECLDRYGPKLTELNDTGAKSASMLVDTYGCPSLKLSGVVSGLLVQYLLDTTHCLHFANASLRVSQKQIFHIRDLSDDVIGSFVQHMSRELQFIVKTLREGIASAGCSLVDYFYTQKHKMQADSPPWVVPSIPVCGSRPKSRQGMFDGDDSFLSVRQLLVLSTALQMLNQSSSHVSSDEFVKCVAEVAENESFPAAWVNEDALRHVAKVFSVYGSSPSGGNVQWKKVLHSAMHAILPRPPSAAQLMNMLDSLSSATNESLFSNVESLPDNFHFWFESENSTQAQVHLPVPPSSSYPGQGWGAGGEARELYTTMFSTPDTGAVNIEKLMLLLCCWPDTQDGEATDMLAAIETRSNLGLARACLVGSAFHDSMLSARNSMRQILDLYGDVFETTEMHTKQFDSAARIMAEKYGLHSAVEAVNCVLGDEVDPTVVSKWTESGENAKVITHSAIMHFLGDSNGSTSVFKLPNVYRELKIAKEQGRS